MVRFDFNARAKEYNAMLCKSHRYHVELEVKLLQEELENRIESLLGSCH